MRTGNVMSLSFMTGPQRDPVPAMRCAILDVVSWHGMAASAGEAEKAQRYGAVARPLVYEIYGRLGSVGIKLSRDPVTTAPATCNCSPHALGRWRTQLERVLLSAEADTSLRALGSIVAATGVLGQQAAVSRPVQEDSRWPCLCLSGQVLQRAKNCKGGCQRRSRSNWSR